MKSHLSPQQTLMGTVFLVDFLCNQTTVHGRYQSLFNYPWTGLASEHPDVVFLAISLQDTG